MLRGDNIVCGTSTTGTGTLTLAATPGPPGGIDLDVLARATGVGFANSAAVLVPYTIIEYTSSAFSTAKAMEVGVGVLTLGGSSGIANATLARTTPQVKATSMDSQPATYTTNAPSAFSITTAANTLVFIGPTAASVFASSPYYDATIGDNLGVASFGGDTTVGTGINPLINTTDYYHLFYWEVPMLVKKCSMRCAVAYVTGSPVSNAYSRIYAQGTDGRPGKLLIDFGLHGTANVSLNTAATNISSAVHSTGYFLTPGWYWFGAIATISGGSTGPAFTTCGNAIGPVTSGRMGTSAMTRFLSATATGGTATPAPDPANVTGWAGQTVSTGRVSFLLAPS